MRVWAPIVGACVAALIAACGSPDDDRAQLPPVPPGDALPEDVEHLLFGKINSCREDEDCASGVCAYATTHRDGTCMGVLTAEAPWMQVEVARALSARVEAQPAIRARIVERLGRVLSRRDAEPAHRVRAIRALEAIGARERLAELYPLLPEGIADAAALALVHLGDASALDHVAALTESRDEPLAVAAFHALGQSQLDGALAPLLRALAPATAHTQLRACVDALERLGDPRAIRPLVDFLDGAPEHLVVDVTMVLRELTGDDLVADAEAWRGHVARTSAPEPPPYTPREHRTEDDLGIPTP